jgi:hypothetical protein
MIVLIERFAIEINDARVRLIPNVRNQKIISLNAALYKLIPVQFCALRHNLGENA